MMLVDSHCHLDRLDLSEYQGDLSAVMSNARQKGVEHFLSVSVDLESLPKVLAIAERFPNIGVSVGVHPTEEISHEPSVEELVQLAKNPLVVAMGETGLDYYRSHSKQKQEQRFRTHIRAAKLSGKPLIVHTRAARKDTILFLKEEQAEEIGGVLHCFTEDIAMAKQALDLGFYISFSGIITFKNAQEIRDVMLQLPLDRILIETDSPYLAPLPYRGKTNQPAYVYYVAECIAELRGIAYEKVAQQTSENFFKLFYK
jgi:TatD DNase family protein